MIEDHSSTDSRIEKGGAYHEEIVLEETTHEAAERGHAATDKSVLYYHRRTT